jgi:hypothetical protein
MQETRAIINNHSDQHIVKFNPQRSKRQHLHEIEEAPNRAERRQLQRVEFHIHNRGLAMQQTRASNQNRCQNPPNRLPNSFRNSTKGTALTRRIRGSANDQQRIRTLHKMLSVISRDLPETRGRL